jgi:hypothetical protein
MLGPVGNDQRFGEQAKDVISVLYLIAAFVVVIGPSYRVSYPFPIKAKLRIDNSFLARVHQVEQQRFKALCHPILNSITLAIDSLAMVLSAQILPNL